eukprot:GEMP01053004.1.p1 GENE.GEMP01053004.1~~GEMP01053004.1.p1  ORF type:complete len:296 (+),score=36.53 GEMP01053004.1:87-974(+)
MLPLYPPPADAIHMTLGSLDSEVDEVTAATVSQLPHFMSMSLVDETERCFEQMKLEYFMSECFPDNFQNLIHESRVDDVHEFLTKPDGEKKFEFGSIFVSGPGVYDVGRAYDLRIDTIFGLFRNDYFEENEMSALWRSETHVIKFCDHPNVTTRNINGMVDLVKLSARLGYLYVRARTVADWKKQSALHKAKKAVYSRPSSFLSKLGSIIGGWEETQEERDQAVIGLSDKEKKRLCVAGIMKVYFKSPDPEAVSSSTHAKACITDWTTDQDAVTDDVSLDKLKEKRQKKDDVHGK